MRYSLELPDTDDREPVPPGWYRTKIDEVAAKTASTGSEYLRIAFRVTDGPHDGRRVWEGFSLRPTALWRLKRLLKAIDLPHQGPVVLETELLEERDLEILIGEETYNGSRRNTVKDMRPIGAAGTDPSPAQGEEIPF